MSAQHTNRDKGDSGEQQTNLIRWRSGWEANKPDMEHGEGTQVLIGTRIRMVVLELGDKQLTSLAVIGERRHRKMTQEGIMTKKNPPESIT